MDWLPDHMALIHCKKQTASPIQRAIAMARPPAAKNGYQTSPATLTAEKSIYRNECLELTGGSFGF